MEKIERILIWSGWLRLSHLGLGLSAVALLVSGWLFDSAPSLTAGAMDVHYLAASVLIASLVLRIVLMFAGSPVERLGRLMPDDGEWKSLRETAVFYLTLGKAPLPRWYAHNPFWKPLYVLMYLALLGQVATGGLMESDSLLVMGFYVPSVHATFASVVGVLVTFHVVAVMLHDYRGDAADISGIINGYRHYTVESVSIELPELQQASVRLDQIGKPNSGPKQDG